MLPPARSTAQAAVSAYVSDCTSPGSRARVFSLLGGCLMGGFACGPLFGSALISLTGGWVLAPFYVALGTHCAFVAGLALVLPESLSDERQLAARERHRLDKLAQRDADKQAGADGHGASFARRTARSLRRAAVKPFAFLKPMALLLPRPVTDEVDDELRTNIEWGAHLDEYAHPKDVWRAKASSGSSAGRRDWALTKIALAYALNMGLMGVMTVKLCASCPLSLPLPLGRTTTTSDDELTLARPLARSVRPHRVRVGADHDGLLPVVHGLHAPLDAPRRPPARHQAPPPPPDPFALSPSPDLVVGRRRRHGRRRVAVGRRGALAQDRRRLAL